MTAVVMYGAVRWAFPSEKETGMSSATVARIGALFTGALLAMSTPSNAATTPATPSPATAPATPGAFPSEAEGFKFLDGEWRVHNRRLKQPLSGREDWQEFEARAKFFTLLDGLVSVEELRDAQGKPFGSAMRTFDRDKRTWSDAWVGARDGVLQLPSHGKFEGGVGTWESPDTYDGQPILARGVWRKVSADVVIWEQWFSRDDGKSWELNWKMRFERTAPVANVSP